jgi:hypothetical protein
VGNFRKTLKIPATIGLNFGAVKLLNRGLKWLPVPSSLKGFVFSSAVQLGLLQVDILKSDNLLSRIRYRALAEIFANPNQTLQLLFPRQDLGIVYIDGWKSGKVTTDFYESDSLEFTPELLVGGRLPHFWLMESMEKRISSLDLPSLMIQPNGTPEYLLLHCGKISKEFYEFEHELREKHSPLKIVSISEDESRSSDYIYLGSKPEFLPSSFTLILRPDGHIAWLSTP